jgi:DNA-damage-inducible protein J
MSATTIQFRTDASLKQKASAVFNQLGMTLSEGMNIYLAQVVLRQAVPFALKTAVGAPEAAASASAVYGGESTRQEAFNKMMELRKHVKPATRREIRSWIEEGRP